MRKYRIAIGAIFTECNHLGGVPIDRARFEQSMPSRGEEMLQLNTGVVGGMLDTLSVRRVEVKPLLYAASCPGGPITANCYQLLKEEIMQRLKSALPVDGVLLPLHGAAAVEGLGSLENDLIASIRQLAGDDATIVATLDLHAHITTSMVEHADALIAWETYPHRDTYATGQRGAQMILHILDEECQSTMAFARVPVITSAINGSTEGDGPFASVMRFAKSLEEENGVLSTSVILVNPYLDLPDMGSGGLVITDNNKTLACQLAKQIADMYWAKRFELEPTTHKPAVAIQRGLALPGGPILLLEAADCCGGGAAGDSVATLRSLLASDVDQPSLVPVVDAEAATACHRAGIGCELTLQLGHKHDPKWGQPITVTGRVTKLTDGAFKYIGGIWDGVEGNMGPSAVFSIGAVQVMINTFATYDWADEQFRSMALDPATVKFIVVKNPMNYRTAYGEIAKAVFVLDTPGPTPTTIRNVTFQKLTRPYFPLDVHIPNLQPTILQSGIRKR